MIGCLKIVPGMVLCRYWYLPCRSDLLAAIFSTIVPEGGVPTGSTAVPLEERRLAAIDIIHGHGLVGASC
jgi:hypothetical protein